MKVMADTNIIISALLFPTSLPAKVLLHIASNHDLVLCDHIVAETRDVIVRKDVPRQWLRKLKEHWDEQDK